MTDGAPTSDTSNAFPASGVAIDVADHPPTVPTGETARMTDEIVAALKTVYDPEIPADLYELGLIYKIAFDDDRVATIDMTLTTPNCPSAGELPSEVQRAVAGVSGVRDVKVNIVWNPPWDPSRMSEEARWVLDMW